MDKQVFKRIHNEALNESFKISIEFEDTSFNLKILQKSKAWEVTVDRRKISSQAKQIELDVDEYYRKIQEYFTKTPENVNFRFSNNEFVVNCSLENNMKVKYFTCKLNEVDYSNCIENLIEKYYSDRINSLQRLEILEEERSKFLTEKNSLETKLTEFIARKKTDDQELYNNFVLVLNEKKKQIQHLNELLEAFRRGRPTLNPQVEVKRRTKKPEVKQLKRELKKEISESDSEDAYDTDEEKEKKRQRLSDEGLDNDTDKRSVDPIPSTSKCDYNLFSDDSPPRHILPKRIKTESSTGVNIVSTHSTSQQCLEHGRDKENITHNNAKEESPDINFSTQDLLDNI